MSPNLPTISGRKAIAVFENIGYQVVRQKGSHIRLRDDRSPDHKPLTIPDHKALKPGLLRIANPRCWAISGRFCKTYSKINI